MNRRLLSLLAVLLLALASQAAADGKHEDEEDDHQDDRDEDDRGKDGGKSRHGKDDDRKERTKAREAKEREREARGEDPAPPATARRPRAPADPEAPASVRGVHDAGLSILPTALPGRAMFSFLVSAGGALDGAAVLATLPDTGSPWVLSGPGAPACGLAGLALECEFEGLAAGDVQLVQASSPIARAPPWELMAQGTIAMAGDAVAGNDAASAGIGLLLR